MASEPLGTRQVPPSAGATLRKGAPAAGLDAGAQILQMLENVRAAMLGNQPPAASSPEAAAPPDAAGPAHADGDAADATEPSATLKQLLPPHPSGQPKTQREQIVERTLALLPGLLHSDVRGFNKRLPGAQDYVDHPPSVLRASLQKVAVALMFNAPNPELTRLKPILEVIYKRIAFLDSCLPPNVAASPGRGLNRRLGLETADHPLLFPVEK